MNNTKKEYVVMVYDKNNMAESIIVSKTNNPKNRITKLKKDILRQDFSRFSKLQGIPLDNLVIVTTAIVSIRNGI